MWSVYLVLLLTCASAWPMVERSRRSAPTSDGIVCRPSRALLVTSQRGTLVSPTTQSGLYPNKLRCAWRVTVAPGKRIKLSASKFDLESTYGCVYDYVQLFDGENTDARSLGRFCGNQFPEAGIMSSGNDLYVKFATDPADAASGFRLDYVAMETEVQPVSCGGLVTGLAGTITSPGYGPGKKYPDNAKCEWKIDVGRNKLVRLQFVTFATELSSGCLYDALAVYDGANDTAPLAGRFCGTSVQRVIQASGRHLFLAFSSDDSVGKVGFKAVYRAINPDTESTGSDGKTPSGCGPSNRPALLTGTEGQIVMPSGGSTENYPDDAFCQWRIEVPQGKRVHVEFTSLAVEADSACQYDHVDVFDGADSSAELLTRLCGTGLPGGITATGNTLLIQFKSDSSVADKGFSLTYSAKNANGASLPGPGNNNISEPACGIPEAPVKFARIVGGQQAVAGSWPWQASVMRYGRHHCGGAVISHRWILTAAHCVYKNGVLKSPAEFKVRLGEHNLKIDEGTEQLLPVSRVVMHENYNEQKTEHDIALLRLARDVKYSAAIKPACLPRKDVEADKLCVVTGWGSTKGTANSIILQQVHVPVLDRSTCKRRDFYSTRFTDAMICAGYPEGGKDACQGDSGGPLVCRENGVYRLHGVVSWGFGCARPKAPGIYTRVAKYVGWIDTKTSGAFQSPA